LERLQQGAKAPQTVYRVLDYLMEHGLVHKLESLNAYVACQQESSNCRHAAAFIICRCCQHVHEIKDLSQLQVVLENYGKNVGFTDLHTVLEIRGLCENCRKQS
jgi:Fur family zinc uptake transcriptional regulator